MLTKHQFLIAGHRLPTGQPSSVAVRLVVGIARDCYNDCYDDCYDACQHNVLIACSCEVVVCGIHCDTRHALCLGK